jgi:ATP-dependent Lon protease
VYDSRSQIVKKRPILTNESEEKARESSLEEELQDAIIQSLEESHVMESAAAEKPEELFIFPLLRRPYFPGMAAPLVVEPGPFYDTLKVIAKTPQKSVGLFLAKDEDTDIYKLAPKDMYKTGVMARILRIIPMEQGGAQVILNMEKRITMARGVKNAKPLKAKVRYHEDDTELTKELKAYSISIISTIKDLLKLNPLFKEELQIFLGHSDFTEPGKLADFACALTTANREELQDVLETFDIPSRVDKALILLKNELDLTQLQFNISQKIEAGINKSQKEFFLREQLKTIKRELGIERDEKSSDFDKFEKRLKERNVPKHVKQVIDEEMEKLSSLDAQSSEYSVCRGYLDWLTTVPWGINGEENLDLDHAHDVLEKDHYGLKDIKERILEFIGVGKLSGGVKGSIICLAGPPGVGKTSIGRSIARALNRKFYRFSVGGMRDEAEIKGHRRTYVGAMPGKLVQALKYCQEMNPVIMLDEIDKIGGNSHQGDPVSALLEVLDPEQNSEFLDHYLDVRCDLSNVLFILTANVLDTIPEPLKDRMEILRLSGYILEEKVEIATKYLIPRNRKNMGLKAKDVTFTRDAIKHIIDGYARESGVRSLESLIKKIFRKTAVEVVKSQGSKSKTKGPIRISVKNLELYLGKPVYTSDRFYEHTPVGVCTGLAWTALGGATLYIEAIKIPHEKTVMKLTGQAGDVMKESSQIAWSYLHSALHKFAPTYNFFDKSEVHLHIPEGATPKDGPSAGITMVTAMLSLLLDEPVAEDLGMTGELTLTGRILPIGGVKEKIVAAKRSKLTTLIFPKDNERDFDKLPEHLKEGLSFHFVDHYDEVFKIAFPDFAHSEDETL